MRRATCHSAYLRAEEQLSSCSVGMLGMVGKNGLEVDVSWGEECWRNMCSTVEQVEVTSS